MKNLPVGRVKSGRKIRLTRNALVEKCLMSQSRTWGMAFHVVGSAMVRACLERLGLRECHLGGYNLHQVTFTATDTSTQCHDDRSKLAALVFIASPGNQLYLGPASVDDLARQVITGVSSHTGVRVPYRTVPCRIWHVLWSQ